jgi:Tfp pilus assembly protein FimV
VSASLTVSFAFASSEPGSSFVCSLDGAAFATCTTPASRTVTPGAHTFKVAAKGVSGNVDATPATVSFTALDCVALGRAFARAAKKAAKLKKAVKTTKADLAQAVKAGHQSEADQLKKQLAKQQKQLKAAKKKLKAAQAAADPCL